MADERMLMSRMKEKKDFFFENVLQKLGSGGGDGNAGLQKTYQI